MKSDCILLREELKEKIRAWLISFHQLDPRYKILTYFNKVASDGADKFCDEDEEDLLARQKSVPPERPFTKIEKLLSDAFHTTSILTVWRPTSNEAMRKMMERTGVGKGLDIKGKSAKQGALSAFVPFMQIHEEADKLKIQTISRKAKLRVYYSSFEAREAAMAELEPLGNDYMEFNEELVIPCEIKKLDQYVHHKLYGLELSQRMFWKAYVTNQDITRGPDTQTGRPSTAGFQDANLKTLKVACEAAAAVVPNPSSPMPVVFQYDAHNPMSVQHLVMAYEENGTVTPVVSDFDGFLLGWRREALWFGCNLPRDQEDLMLWCVDNIEKILDDTRPSADTWTVRWLEVLKEETTNGFHPEIPEYGFGDPKSYGIMERAALQLIDTGAVRHGSECFNYYFPQEIDETFLLISDTLKPVPWRYVNVTELQAILSQRVKDGFVFPLNPKWILCDPGWKELYDELMASDALYAEYTKDVWYPPFSGVREKIDRIHKKHPNGFQRSARLGRGRASIIRAGDYSPLRQGLYRGITLSGNAAFDLAELELENFKSKKSLLAQQIQMAGLGSLPEPSSSSSSDDDSEDDDSDNEDNNLAQLELEQFKSKKLLLAQQIQMAGSLGSLPEPSSSSDDDHDHDRRIHSNLPNGSNHTAGTSESRRGKLTRSK